MVVVVVVLTAAAGCCAEFSGVLERDFTFI